MYDLSWVDEFMPSVEGITLKSLREEGVTEKAGQWRYINGHPVLIGGSGGGSSGGGSSGGKGKTTKVNGHDLPTTTHNGQTYAHAKIRTSSGQEIDSRIQTHTNGTRVQFSHPSGMKGNGPVPKRIVGPGSAWSADQHKKQDEAEKMHEGDPSKDYRTGA